MTEFEPPDRGYRPFAALAVLALLFAGAALLVFELGGRNTAVTPVGAFSALLRLPTLTARTRFSIDTVGVGPTTYVVRGVQPKIEAPSGTVLTVTGWAVDDAARKPGKAIFVRVDDGPPVVARDGIERDDVASALGVPAYAASGFEAKIPTAGLQPGQHELSLEIANVAGTGLYRVPKRIEFVVTPVPKGAVRRLRTLSIA